MNIVILSRSAALYSTNSLFTAARRRGHYVRIIDYMQCDLVVDSKASEILYQGERLRNIHAVIPRIGSSATSFGAAVIRQFEAIGAYTTLGATPLLECRNKVTCLQILARHGLLVPKTVLSNDYYELDQLIERAGGLPVIIKMINGTHGLGVMKLDQMDLVESVLETMTKTKQRVLLQTYIAESKGADLRAFVVDGEVVGSMKRQARPGDFRSNLHRGGTATVIPLTKEEQRTALKAVDILGLSVAGVDMLQSDKGPMILEVNASPGLEGIEGTTGVDISGKIMDLIEKNKVRY